MYKIFTMVVTLSENVFHEKETFTCDYEESWDNKNVTLRFLKNANIYLVRKVLKKYKDAKKIIIENSTFFGNSKKDDEKLPYLLNMVFKNCKFEKINVYRKICDCSFINCKFFEAGFGVISNSKFKNCIFSETETNIYGIDKVYACEFSDCLFVGEKYGYDFPLEVISCTYKRCQIKRCKMGIKVDNVKFTECNMIDVNFSHADISLVSFIRTNMECVFFAHVKKMRDMYVNHYRCFSFDYGERKFIFIPDRGIIQHNREYTNEFPDSSKFEFNVKDFDNFIQKYYPIPKEFRSDNICEYERHMNYIFVKSLKEQINTLYNGHLELKKHFIKIEMENNVKYSLSAQEEKIVYKKINQLLSQGKKVDFTGTTISPYSIKRILENEYGFELNVSDINSFDYYDYFYDNQGREIIMHYSAETFELTLELIETEMEAED